MKIYESVDMNGQPIENCPSLNDIVAIQADQPANERVKVWIIPANSSDAAAILYRGEDGIFHNMDSIAGAPGKDGISPTLTISDLLNDNGEKIGVELSSTDANGTTSSNIVNGEHGEKGVGIVSIDKTGSAGLVDTYTITYSDNSTTTFCITNAGSVEKLSQLENDAGFIIDTVNNLVNYYTKEQTYSKEEVAELVAHLSAGIKTEIVVGNASGKPNIALADIDTSTIYLVQDGTAYAQWMWIGSEWAKLGTTAVNLSEYYNKTEIDSKLGLYVSTTALLSILDSYAKTANLAKVATSGDYNDLKNLPEIPDMSGLASIAYVDNKVNEAHSDTDLSQYRKKTDTINYTEISGRPTVDAALSTTSTNAVQNKVLTAMINNLFTATGFTVSYKGDLNSILKTCIVNANVAASQMSAYHWPSVSTTNPWAFLITFIHCNANTYGAQVLIGMTESYVYYRIKNTTWGAWKRVTLT